MESRTQDCRGFNSLNGAKLEFEKASYQFILQVAWLFGCLGIRYFGVKMLV